MTREEAIDFLKRMKWQADYVEMGDEKGDEVIDMAIEALQQPEIIRCKDCQFYAISRQGKSWCKSSTRHIKPEDFCSSGWGREE